MDVEAVFKRYDIRGRYPEEIDEKFAERLGKAYGTFITEKGGEKAVVAKDTKPSSDDLKRNFIEGLISTGIDVLDAGTGPTDYAAFYGAKKNCFSAEITSSHMPLKFNGFKFMYPEGNGLLNEDLDKVKDLFRSEQFNTGKGSVERIEQEASKVYIKEIRKYFSTFQRGDLADKKVILETMGGATSKFLPRLLEKIGFEVIDLSEDYDAPKIDPPNPEPENLGHVERKVDEEDTGIGIATDLDGDRVSVYDGDGWIGGNEIFMLLISVLKPEKVVASVDSSSAVEEMADRIGSEIYYTRVGDPFVISETLKRKAELSGEPNGHYCFSEFVPYNSGTLGALFLASIDLDDISHIPKRYNFRRTVEVENKERMMDELVKKVEKDYDVISKVDGIKFRVNGAEVLIRPSGSSSKLRIIADAVDENEAQEAIDKTEEMVRNS